MTTEGQGQDRGSKDSIYNLVCGSSVAVLFGHSSGRKTFFLSSFPFKRRVVFDFKLNAENGETK